jgi:hypothetical protein
MPQAMGVIWTIVIGFVAGVIAKFIMPGRLLSYYGDIPAVERWNASLLP